MPGSTGSILDLATHITCPVLGLFGGADPGIPASDVQALDEKLDQAGVEHEIIVYPDAPHSFFDRRATDYCCSFNRLLAACSGVYQFHSYIVGTFHLMEHKGAIK